MSFRLNQCYKKTLTDKEATSDKDMQNYNLCIDMFKVGIKKAANIILKLIDFE